MAARRTLAKAGALAKAGERVLPIEDLADLCEQLVA
jgi:hypothetical protein